MSRKGYSRETGCRLDGISIFPFWSPMNPNNDGPAPADKHDPHYIVTQSPTCCNSALLGSDGHLRPELRRNADYLIVPESTWREIAGGYDTEIPTADVYMVHISFSCHGQSHKSILVHGVEKVFDVILTLFVNKMFGLDAFRRMFVVKHGGREIDPMVNFEWFGDLLGTEPDCGSTCSEEACSGRHTPGARRSVCLTVERIRSGRKRRSEPSCSESWGFQNTTDAKLKKWDVEEPSTATESSNSTSPSLYVESSTSRGCVGLPNVGNTCFMNCAIQCLSNCREIEDYFVGSGHTGTGPRARVVGEWAGLLKSMDEHSVVSTRRFKDAMGEVYEIYRSHEEQDSFEFINNLLDLLHEELKSSRSKGAGDAAAEKENRQAMFLLGAEKAWDEFIKDNGSVIAHTFYGLSTTVLECLRCGNKRSRTDPFMTLSLPILPETRYHPSVALVFETGRLPMKILVPLALDVPELVSHVKKKYAIENDLLPVEYKGGAFCGTIHKPIALAESIYLFEYRRGAAYRLCSMSHNRLFFFKERLGLDFILPECAEEGDTLGDLKIHIFRKLEPFFSKSLSIEEFFQYVNIQQSTHNPFFNTVSINLHFTKASYLFGANTDILRGSAAEKQAPLTLNDCLNAFFRRETVSLACEGSCRDEEDPGRPQKGPHAMSTVLMHLPSVLIIQLKRFTYVHTGAKIGTFVDFPVNNLVVNGACYRLIGTCNHIEIGMGYGHYLSYVCRRGQWYSCNDSVISKCSEIDKRSAYILFYQMVA